MILYKIYLFLYQWILLVNNFLDLLDKYPVTPYLSSRMSFMKWVNFIFNKINKQLKEEIGFYEDLEKLL